MFSIVTVYPQKDAAATIYFSATSMQRLFKGSAYSRAVFNWVLTCKYVPSTFTCQLPADIVTNHGEFVFICSFICTSLLGSPS